MKTFVIILSEEWGDIRHVCVSDCRFETVAEVETYISKFPKDSVVEFESGKLDLKEYYGSNNDIQSLDTWVESHTN